MNYWSMPSLRERQKAMKEKNNYVDNIIKEICKFYYLSVDEVIGKSRKREIVKARFIAIYIIRMETDFKLSAIGRIFNRDHSTILHSIRIITNTLKLKYDTDISDELSEIKKIINNLTY
jgi:chromosomal replication initiator protein